MSVTRCPWVGDDPRMRRYHDEVWGVPLHDERALFEMLVLESFQAGLSWRTILTKQEAFRRAFAGFDPEAVAAFGPADESRLLADAGIVRNRAKIRAAIANASAFLEVQRAFGSFDTYLWSSVEGAPLVHEHHLDDPPPATHPVSDALSADLKRRGFRFLGSTTVYAFLQATGVVNDHLMECFRYDQCTP